MHVVVTGSRFAGGGGAAVAPKYDPAREARSIARPPARAPRIAGT
jgi:hypothetical protein